MKTAERPISEINRQATQILFKEMGVVETIRFLNFQSVEVTIQRNVGSG
ncbi:hypothetical protein [uncultured Desulfobacter sp.]|nr:hypothetical protein [uncultured Desulfobacter sp.]